VGANKALTEEECVRQYTLGAMANPNETRRGGGGWRWAGEQGAQVRGGRGGGGRAGGGGRNWGWGFLDGWCHGGGGGADLVGITRQAPRHQTALVSLCSSLGGHMCYFVGVGSGAPMGHRL